MNLLKFFKREKESDESAVAVAPPPIAKPASERYGKTVMPSVPRYAETEVERSSPPVNIAPISLPSVAPIPPRTISLGEKPDALPKIAAPTPADSGSRTVALLLSEIVPQIPAEVLRHVEIDPLQRVSFNAADLERGMANGRPTVLLRDIFQQAPEIFAQQIPAEDAREIAFPFEKVLEHFTQLLPRGDQQQEENGPEFETLFSKVTREDRARFGTAANLKLSPNGTGVPASERVPASSGPSVPTLSPAPIAPKIARTISLKPEPTQPEVAQLSQASDETETMAQAKPEGRVSLSLRAILKETLPSQYSGKIDEIPDETRIEVPLARVKRQLSSGKVEISAEEFCAALPDAFRPVFDLDNCGLPVQLPLAEVVRNLPNESLHRRADQVETIVPQIFETPFSQKAAEDAARLKIFSGPITAGKAAENTAASAVESPHQERSRLQELLATDDALDPKSIVAHISRLPGISSCVIVFSDGLSLAGNIPAEFGSDAISALVPERNYSRASAFAQNANFGSLHSLSLFCDKASVSFFSRGDICLTTVQQAEISGETRTRLGRIAEELAQMFSTGKKSPNDGLTNND